jgi:hypothetical protein
MTSTFSPGRTCTLGELSSVHLRHDDVGHHQIDLVRRLLEDLERRGRIWSADCSVVKIPQRLDQIPPQVLVVLDHQNDFAVEAAV